MEGIALFNKPKNYTSYDIVRFLKKKTRKKVGHGGTLDPFAEGLLILGIGEYTQELTKFSKESTKTYVAEITLGARSTTYDREGEIICVDNTNNTRIETNDTRIIRDKFDNIRDKFVNYNFNQINEVLNSFVGEIEQTPPPFSAVKIKGKPAYVLARKGIKVELKPRKVKIYDIKILDYNWPKLKFEITCTSGTYIRSLANDIGEKLGCGGYLSELQRIKINEFTLEQALTFEDMEKDFLEFYAKVYGRVQGVGYRYFVKEKAQVLDVVGYVKNLEDGTVEVLAQGKEENLQKLIQELKKGPFLARVDKLDIIFRKPKNVFSQFQINY